MKNNHSDPMSRPPGRLSRRDFIRASSAGVVGAGMALTGLRLGAEEEKPPAEKIERRNQQEGMRYRVLGRTRLEVSVLSLGGLSLEASVMAAAIDRGINLVHGSPGYGCFPAQASVLKTRRDQVFYVLKGYPDPTFVDDCLKALGLDYVDILTVPIENRSQAHGDPAQQAREAYEKLREAGKVRFLGLTVHGDPVEGTAAGVESGVWDVIMPNYNPQVREQIDPLADRAAEKKIGMMAMKTMMGLPPQQWPTHLKVMLGRPSLHSLLKSIPSRQALEALCQAVGQMPTPEEMDADQQQVSRLRGWQCASCDTCAGCPNGVRISENLRCLQYYAGQMGEEDYARRVYHSLPPQARASNCRQCGRCEGRCPNGLPVRQWLRETAARFA